MMFAEYLTLLNVIIYYIYIWYIYVLILSESLRLYYRGWKKRRCQVAYSNRNNNNCTHSQWCSHCEQWSRWHHRRASGNKFGGSKLPGGCDNPSGCGIITDLLWQEFEKMRWDEMRWGEVREKRRWYERSGDEVIDCPCLSLVLLLIVGLTIWQPDWDALPTAFRGAGSHLSPFCFKTTYSL